MDNSSQNNILDLRLKMVEQQISELKESDAKNKDDTQEKLDRINQSMIEVLRFMSAQEEKNLAAEKERDRIFKASTLLPVAILTAVINIGVNAITKPNVPEPPPQATYVIPYRDDQRGLGRLELKD